MHYVNAKSAITSTLSKHYTQILILRLPIRKLIKNNAFVYYHTINQTYLNFVY